MCIDDRNTIKKMCSDCEKEVDPKKLFAAEMIKLGFKISHGTCIKHARQQYEKLGIPFNPKNPDSYLPSLFL